MPRVFQCRSAIADATARRSVAYLGCPNCKRVDGLMLSFANFTVKKELNRKVRKGL